MGSGYGVYTNSHDVSKHGDAIIPILTHVWWWWWWWSQWSKSWVFGVVQREARPDFWANLNSVCFIVGEFKADNTPSRHRAALSDLRNKAVFEGRAMVHHSAYFGFTVVERYFRLHLISWEADAGVEVTPLGHMCDLTTEPGARVCIAYLRRVVLVLKKAMHPKLLMGGA